MAFSGFADGAAMFDATSIENLFIMEYMPIAPGEFVKVYLFMRMLALHPEACGDIAELARLIGLDAATVTDALAFWERQGLMQRVRDNPPAYVILPMRAPKTAQYDRDYYKYRDFDNQLANLFTSGVMRPAQFRMANEWLDELGLSQDAIFAILKFELAHTRAKKPDPEKIFKSANKRATAFAARDIKTLDAVERELASDTRVEKLAIEVLKQFSYHRSPTLPEMRLATKWMDEWKLTEKQIIAGCAETVKAQNPSFAYLDAVLTPGNGGGFAEVKEIFNLLGLRAAPSKSECAKYEKWIGEGFEPETVELAAKQQARKNKRTFEGLENMIGLWRERGLYKYTDADEYVTKNRALYEEFSALLREAGISGAPTENDIVGYAAYKQALDIEAVKHAAALSKGRSYPISYMLKLTDGWIAAGARTLEDVKALSNGAQSKENPALKYEQRDIKDEDFGEAFFRKSMDEFINGSGANDQS